MKQQRIRSVLCIPVFLLFLLATATSCTEKIGTTKIKIFQANQDIAVELEQAAREYERSHPKIEITVEAVKNGDDYETVLRKKLKTGKSLNIFSLTSPNAPLEWKDKLEYLGNLPWAALVPSDFLSEVTFDGKIYGLPYEIKSYGFIYNKQIFKAAGINVSSIINSESMEQAFSRLDSQIKSGVLKKEFPLLEAVTEFPAKNAQTIGLYSSSPILGVEFSTPLNALETKRLLFPNAFSWKDLIDIQVKYSSSKDNPEALLSVDETEQIERGIAVERVAVVQQGNWIYNRVAAINRDVADSLGIFSLFPPGAFTVKFVAGATMHWAVNKDTNNWSRIAAKDFLNWLYTSEPGNRYITEKFSFVSPLLFSETNRSAAPLNRDMLSYANNENIIPWVYTGFPPDWGTNVLGVGVQDYLAGKTSWGNMIAIAKERWEELRKTD